MHDIITRITLESLHNTRDLGGISAMGGQKIKKHRLIRSGRRANLTEKDKQTLYTEYHLRTVVDFRTHTEFSEVPDDVIEGVTYIHLPIVEEALLGITKEKEDGANSFSSLMQMMKDENFSAENFMASIYSGIISSEYSRNQYREFFKIVLNQSEDAVLWHCSAGKDRVGAGTAILLSALGCSRETIIRDYLMTNDFTSDETERTLTAMRYNGMDEKIISGMRAMHRVEECYINAVFSTIDADFGGIDRFLSDEMKLGRYELKRLHEMYLE